MSMFDFCYVISAKPKIKVNVLHQSHLGGIPYESKIVSGANYALEYFQHTDLPEMGFAAENTLSCSLLGKASTNRLYQNELDKELKLLKAKDILAMYDQFGEQLVRYIKGIFLIVICDERRKSCFAYTSKSGLYRLYYAMHKDKLLISSSISSIINNMDTAPALDGVALMQHSVFDHTLGERTFYQGISILDNHSYLSYDMAKMEIHPYHDFAKQLNSKAKYTWKETNLLLPKEFNNAMDAQLLEVDKFNSALTGGYDSRTILSYILNKGLEGYRLYSWAASKEWPDVAVAEAIAQDLKLRYDAIDLGEEMIQNYEENADKQIYWTDGSGSIKRSNQMYSHNLLAKHSRDLITGYFGSELFRPLARENIMISNLMVDLLFCDDPKALLIAEFDKKSLTGFDAQFVHAIKEEFLESSLTYFKSLQVSEQKHINYFHYIIKTGFWKFFGQELHGQRINSHLTSPYLDDDFVMFLAHTPILDLHQNTYKKKGVSTLKGQALYHPILKQNFPQLMNYKTNRGFAPKDFDSMFFPLNVMSTHYFTKRKHRKKAIVGFNAREWDRKIFEKRAPELSCENEVFSSFDMDNANAAMWYSMRWYINTLQELSTPKG